MKKKKFKLTDKQVKLFTKDMQKFGYNVSEKEIRKIADRVCSGEKFDDVIAMILTDQLKQAGFKL